MKLTMSRIAAAAVTGAVLPAVIVPATGAAVRASHAAGTSAHHAAAAMLTGTGEGSGSNAELGQRMAAAAGWTGTQWDCLNWLWTRESGWSNTADTRVTHAGGDYPGSPVWAYGIAQARPATKYPRAGQSADLGGQSDPASQIRWGLSYIAGVYGTPCGAWNHETSAGWY